MPLTTKRLFLAVVVLLAFFATACRSVDTSAGEDELPSLEDSTQDPSVGSSESGDDARVDPDEAFARFEACMADRGVEIQMAGVGGGAELPDPDFDPGSLAEFSPEDFAAAQEECDPILDDAFGGFHMDPDQEAEFADMMLELERCLVDAGFEIEMGSAGDFALPGDTDFEAFDAAMEQCDEAAGLAGFGAEVDQ